jgi:choline dehydrogenase
MEDHLDIFEVTIQNGATSGATANPSTDVQLIDEYRANRTGLLTNAPADYIGWEKLPEKYRSSLSAAALADLARFPADWPEVREAGFSTISLALE